MRAFWRLLFSHGKAGGLGRRNMAKDDLNDFLHVAFYLSICIAIGFYLS